MWSQQSKVQDPKDHGKLGLGILASMSVEIQSQCNRDLKYGQPTVQLGVNCIDHRVNDAPWCCEVAWDGYCGSLGSETQT